jgi:FAD/FMN-containing dehydrogenase
MTTSSLADTVLEVTWVDGTGKVHVSKKGDPEFAALNGGLGVFGVMTELLLQLTPPSNTQLITVTKNDTNMMQEINKLLKVGGGHKKTQPLTEVGLIRPVGMRHCRLMSHAGLLTSRFCPAIQSLEA